MEQSKKDVDLGRFISLILRHQPEAIGISLDENGWANTDELIAGINEKGESITKEDLDRIVRENNKKRYIFNEDKTKIRANQGHSIEVDIGLEPVIPPAFLYHGTGEKSVSNIMAVGIEKRSRQYVHLSSDLDTAVRVGARHGSPVVFTVKAGEMYEKGWIFYRSENGVWLCEYIPKEFVEMIK